jgi:hypothetical protein
LKNASRKSKNTTFKKSIIGIYNGMDFRTYALKIKED